MALPVVPLLVSGLVRAFGRIIPKLLTPALLAFGAWFLEQITGLFSWIFRELGILAASLVGGALRQIDLPDAMFSTGWSDFGHGLIIILHTFGVIAALELVVQALILRLVLFAVTLGRY